MPKRIRTIGITLAAPRHLNHDIAELASHPGWGELRKRAAKARDQYFANLGKTLYLGEPVSDADLHYRRGFFRGMNYILNQGTIEADALERELKTMKEA